MFSTFFSPVHTNQAIRCCDNDGFSLTPRYIHPSCMPISVPYEDPFFKSKFVTCMEYTRSVTTYRGDCTFGASEQVRFQYFFLLFLMFLIVEHSDVLFSCTQHDLSKNQCNHTMNMPIIRKLYTYQYFSVPNMT